MISNFLEVSMIEVHFQLPHCKNLQCKQPDNNLTVSTLSGNDIQFNKR